MYIEKIDPHVQPVRVFIPTKPVRTPDPTRPKPIPADVGTGFLGYGYGLALRYPRVTRANPLRHKLENKHVQRIAQNSGGFMLVQRQVIQTWRRPCFTAR